MSDSKAGGTSVRRPRAPSERLAATSYDKDVILWSEEQARLLRAGRFADLDIEHLADEIEDVGKSEKREFASRMAVLLAHLLKWSRRPKMRTNSRRSTIIVQRKRVALALKATPSLKAVMRDPVWQEDIWLDAAAQAQKETAWRKTSCPRPAPGRWSRRPIRISGRSEELFRANPFHPSPQQNSTGNEREAQLASSYFVLRMLNTARKLITPATAM
jgi:Domain of unknown function DUF29